ncbi:hypothetical protein GCM10010345_22780 [Streptomyces canarius]|uniref:Uncharacterized protein n=1 Tax=Streptomyces canarius TaxID=285453 RepID=A0ABQ3CJF6_9ACTN|nr:hypothetical protein GCM10010345_22780 [Streptomyces canarius]
MYGVPESPVACAAGTAKAERARAPETAATVARMRMCVPLEGEVIVESVDSCDQIREAGGGLYGKTSFRPDLGRGLPAHDTTEKERSAPGSDGRHSRGRTRAAYCTSTKSPVALTAEVVEPPAKEKRK